MIDSHCHLDHEPLFANLDKVLERSKNVGIKKILTISTSLKSFQNIIEIIKKDTIIYGTFGIHPHETNNDTVSIEEIIQNVKEYEKIIGVGETGLDFYYNNSDKKKQIQSFEQHIQASIMLRIPLIVHSRNAENETFDILNNFKNENLKILMHCFTGSKIFSEKLLKLNTFFSASGIITFKNAIELQDTFKSLPLDRLMIETDSPFLAPEPKRGKKNEPSYIQYTAEKLAKLKNISKNELIIKTSQNFNNLFFN